MTSTEFATHIRFMTRTTSVTFTDAQILALMKIRQDEIARAILKVDEDILLIPQKANLVANQREYALPEDMISRIKRVSALFNGSDWIPLTFVDITDIDNPIETEANITDIFSNYQFDADTPDGARYNIRRKSIYIYSGTIASVTNGLKIYAKTYPTAIAALNGTDDMSIDPSTTTLGVPRELHEIWARGVIIDYKSSREKPIPLTEKELSYKFDRDEAIESLKHADLDRQITGKLPDSSERGNDGFDY